MAAINKRRILIIDSRRRSTTITAKSSAQFRGETTPYPKWNHNFSAIAPGSKDTGRLVSSRLGVSRARRRDDGRKITGGRPALRRSVCRYSPHAARLDGIRYRAAVFREIDPEILAVLCSAYSDYLGKISFVELGRTDRFLVLRKPFDNVEVRQFTAASPYAGSSPGPMR